MAFRFSSPDLREEDRILRECPVGAVLREAPYVYGAINAHAYAENGAFNPLESPLWLQAALRIVGSEKARHLEAKMEEDRVKRDSKRGMAVRSRR